MIQYHVAKCNLCDSIINVWVGVGFAERQKMSFLCPECESEIHVTLVINYSPPTAILKSEDIKILNHKRDETRKGVNIYSDLPVRKDKQGISLMFGGSAFMDFVDRVPQTEFTPYNDFKNRIQNAYDKSFHAIRRTAIIYNVGNYSALGKQLCKISKVAKKRKDSTGIIDIYHSMLCTYGLPDFNLTVFNSAFKDLLIAIKECKNNNMQALDIYFRTLWDTHDYKTASGKLINTFVRFIERYDALILGASFVALENSGANLEDYMTFRSDFSELKSIYVDAYELSMQFLMYIIPIYNLSNRGNYELWSNGKQESLQAFHKRTSNNKEFAFESEPEINKLYSKINRTLRNKIGHYDIHYDVKSSKLLIGSSKEILLSEFIISFNNAYQTITFLLCFERIMRFERVKLATSP